LAITIDQQKLIPDQLFALNYGGSFRAFMLEIDRGTEPKTSASARKSYAKSIEQYRQLVEQEIYKSHYGLKANLLILWVFSKRSNELRYLDMIAKVGGKLARTTLTQSWTDWGAGRAPRNVQSGLYSAFWNRANNNPIKISKP